MVPSGASGIESKEPTPSRASGMAPRMPGMITVCRLVRRLAMVGSMLAELSTRKNTSASRMRVAKVNSRVSRIPVVPGA
ncbi:MAG: hypothetical protein IPF99_27235 [Deltaproteobacteria bacterium]|nr:hypothetical protein [Deltaproteobacteria bacterium]